MQDWPCECNNLQHFNRIRCSQRDSEIDVERGSDREEGKGTDGVDWQLE